MGLAPVGDRLSPAGLHDRRQPRRQRQRDDHDRRGGAEFDSGMNAGTGQDEVQRIGNFGQGAEENPTVAQSQPTSRAVQQTAVVGPGGAPLSVPGAPPAANLGNSMNVGGLTGYDLMMENAGILDALGILPPGVGGGSGSANRSSPYSSALTPPPSGMKSRSLGNGDGLTRGGDPQTPPRAGGRSPTAPVEQAPGSQIDPGQSAGADDSATRDDEAKSLGDYYNRTVGLAADLTDEPPGSRAGGHGKLLRPDSEVHGLPRHRCRRRNREGLATAC